VDRIAHSNRSLAALVGTAVLLGAAILALAGGGPKAQAAGCPSFEVLHNDRIGAASLPAGTYAVTTADASSLSCQETSALFARFLEDYDGTLPGGWRVAAQGSGRASFSRPGNAGFSVTRTGGGKEESGTNPLVGKLCPNFFTVNSRATSAGLVFPKGRYLLYQPAGTGITCNRAAVLFSRFLSQPGGRLPSPWQLKGQTATFFKPEHPLRSAFRVEPYSGT
jgi:hypothetical protein